MSCEFLQLKVGKVKRKQTGFIKKDQLLLGGRWVLNRNSPKCENCFNNDKYEIWEEIKLEFFRQDTKFKIVCSNCDMSIELDDEEFLRIARIANLNQKHKLGKIDDLKYQKKIDDVLSNEFKKLKIKRS